MTEIIQRNELGQFIKGHTFRIGSKHTKETREKMREAWKHKTHNWGDKISKALKGKMPKNIEMIKGWFKGKKLSKSHIENISKGKKGLHSSPKTEFKKGMTPYNKGQKMPERSGENHHNWKDGRSRACKTGYYSTEYKWWRMKVFERDNYTCQICGKVGGYLEAHHIKTFIKYPKLKYDTENGVTLCKECHRLVHKKL